MTTWLSALIPVLISLTENFFSVLIFLTSTGLTVLIFRTEIVLTVLTPLTDIQVTQLFDCLAVTLEMPYKDTFHMRDPVHGWYRPSLLLKFLPSFLNFIRSLLP